nr:BolA family transcriptional regulator [Propionivibrio sp.]
GDDNYPKALIVSSQFVGKSRVQRQQMVNALLKPYFDSGELHSLQMQTMTPDEWSAARG